MTTLPLHKPDDDVQAADVDVDADVVAVVVVSTAAACSLVRMVSIGWHAKTATAPLHQPAMKSTYQSDMPAGGAGDNDSVSDMMLGRRIEASRQAQAQRDTAGRNKQKM